MSVHQQTRVKPVDISTMLEVQVKEMNAKENSEHNTKMFVKTRDFRASECNSVARSSNLTTCRTGNILEIPDRPAGTAVTTISQEENTFYKLLFNDIASVRFYRLHCTACNVHIGSAPAQIHNMFQHPVLRTLLCARCHEFYGDGTFEQGDDATDMFCRWCANGGNLYCCSYCSNTFCYKCIKRNFSSLVRKKIEADEKWKCFVCNPGDLYTARAMCWAILQHVQTLTRILKNDKKMSAKEIEEKMNLDESQCCTRRSKRRCRRVDSNSDEEDETYSSSESSTKMRRKMKKPKLTEHSNHTTPIDKKQIRTYSKQLIPIRPRPTTSMNVQTVKADLSQSRIEHKKQIVSPSQSVINMDTSSLSRYSDSGILQPSFYHTFTNDAGSSTYVQVSPVVKPAHQITLPSVSSKLASYQPSLPKPQPPSAMVSNSAKKHNKPRFLLPKTKLNSTLIPNIIELDSDSDDDPKVIEHQNDPAINTNVRSNMVVPVALTWENSDDDDARQEQPLREIRASVEKGEPSFNKVMSPHSQELDKVLCHAKEKVCLLFDSSETIQDEPAAYQKIKNFYTHMRKAVLQLTHINDRVVREYDGWIKSRKTKTDMPSSIDGNTSVIQENVEISLDMSCVNDSDTDSDFDTSKCRIKESSELVKSNNIIKDLLFFKEDMYRDVGDDTNVLCADKAIQVCEVASCDYEKHIDHFSLNKTDYSRTNTTADNDASKTVESSKHFSKYEEQFIYYLQHIEDHGITIENTKELDEIPSQNIDLFNSTVKQTRNNEQKNTENCNSLLEDKIDISINTIHKNKITNESNIKLVNKESQKNNNRSTKEKTISIISKNDANSSQKDKVTINTEMAALTENEDCTIIDD